MNRYFLYTVCWILIAFSAGCVSSQTASLLQTELKQKEDALADDIQRGKTLFTHGDYTGALRIWEKAISLMDKQKYPSLYLDTLIRASSAWQATGFHRQAIEHLLNALPVAEKHDNPKQKALFFNALGDLYLSLGDVGKASEFITKALDAAKTGDSPKVIASVLNNTGNTLAADEDYNGAMAAYIESLDNAVQTSEDSALISGLLINIARVSFLDGEFVEAAEVLETAVLYTEGLPDSYEKTVHLLSLNRLIDEILPELPSDENEAAASLIKTSFELLNLAKPIAEDRKDYRTLSYIHGYMGQLYEDDKKYADALNATRRAIFFAQQASAADILYLWHWQNGRILKATGDAENAIASFRESIEVLNPIRSELLRGYRNQKDAFQKIIRPVYLEMAELLLNLADKSSEADSAGSVGSNAALKGDRERRLTETIETMELLKAAELQDYFQDECVVSARAEKTVVSRTTPHTAVLYPLSLLDRLVLIVILPEGIRQVSSSVDAETLAITAYRFRYDLQNRSVNRFIADSRQLYDWLIRPIEQELANHQIDTLIISPDGMLRMVPFASLSDGNRFLIEKIAIATIPAMNLTDFKPGLSEQREILIAGLSEGVQEFSPLPNVSKEISEVKAIMSGKTVLQDKDYTLENLYNAFKTTPYSILHLATHGLFGGSPEETFLLTYNDRLTMNRLEDLIGIGRYRGKPVELLTLSACQTALGDERSALGLGGVAVKSGVRSAVATLWYVDDEAASLVIQEFYRQLKKPEMSKAKALQQAQASLLSKPRFRHPAYWAPFLLIGNWL